MFYFSMQEIEEAFNMKRYNDNDVICSFAFDFTPSLYSSYILLKFVDIPVLLIAFF